MHIDDFDFDLPPQLVAQQPPAQRGSSRLLVALPGQPLADAVFGDLPAHIAAGDLLVFNNTRVIKARLFGQKASGGKIEALVERVLDAHTALAHVRSSKSPKPGTELVFEGGLRATMQARHGELFELRFAGDDTVWALLERHGHLPLPPYIERAAGAADDERYQTVYAKHEGAVAAPTAGLHFTEALRQNLQAQGVVLAEITLHVGAGTFQPVRVDNIAEHTMHSEWYEVGSVQRVGDIIGEITAAATEQSAGIGQVNQSVGEIDRMTQQNAALVEESAAAAESLREQADRLSQVVQQFRLAEGVQDGQALAPTRAAARHRTQAMARLA